MANRFSLGLFVPNNRSIANLTADVTIEESERDEVTITEHPVGQGAPIADHAFKRPEEVTIRVGWSEQLSGDISESGIYGYLLRLQASFDPFDLYTGKRRHRNMLITSLWSTTDEHSEYTLMATLICKEIILTKTATAQVSGMSGNNNDHANPAETGSSVNGGDQQLQISSASPGTATTPASTSLNNIFNIDVPHTDALDKGLGTIPDISAPPQLAP